MLKRIGLLLVLVIAVVPLSVYADGPGEGRAARTEVRFMEGMIDHHQMALDMAEHCTERVSMDSVRTVCQNVIDTQTLEIEMMREWLLEWYGIEYMPLSMSELMDLMGLGASSGMDMGHGDHTTNPLTDMPMMMGMMSGLDRVEGIDYDIAWLEAMIDHHDDALHMSERVLRYAEHEELRDLAQRIIDDQTTEIEAMEALLVEIIPAE